MKPFSKMIDLPAELDAGPDDVREAAAVVARLTAPGASVASALAADLAAGLDGRPLMITAYGEAATLAQNHWRTTLAACGGCTARTTLPRKTC